MIERVNPSSLCEPLGGVYTQVAIAPTGRTAYLSGQVALDSEGQLVGAGDHGAQARQCFTNIAAGLQAIGAGPEQIAKMTLHVVDLAPSLIPSIFGAGQSVFGDDWPVCASTMLGVGMLGSPDWLIEVEVVVALSDQAPV